MDSGGNQGGQGGHGSLLLSSNSRSHETEGQNAISPFDIENNNNNGNEIGESIHIAVLEGRLVEILASNNSVRTFSYICGALSPRLSKESPWYLFLAFAWSWLLRLGLVAIIIATIVTVLMGNSETSDTRSKIIHDVQIATRLIFFFQMILILPIIYDLGFKHAKIKYLKSDKSSIFVDLSGLWREIGSMSLLVLALFVAMEILIAANPCLTGCPATWHSALSIFPLLPFECYVFFALSHDLKYIEALMDQELLEPASTGSLSEDRFSAIRTLIEHRSDSHILAYSLFVLITILSCATFLLNIFLIIMLQSSHIETAIRALGIVIFDFKDIYLTFRMIWKISFVNEKSNSLTLKLSKSKPTPNNISMFMQQSAEPTVYKLFGLVAIYQTELILGLAGYFASFLATILKSHS